MRRILIISAAAVVAVAPALSGLLGNQSFAQSVPVSLPSQAAAPDDRGNHPEPGDDKGGRATATPSSSADDHGGRVLAATAAPSASADDHGNHAEPGDDKGGRATAAATATSSPSPSHSEPGDDHGVHPEPGDDHGGDSGRSSSDDSGGSHGSDDSSVR